MDLRSFDPVYATSVASWATTASEVVMWCGKNEFPMRSQAIAEWQHDDDVQAYMLSHEETICAYGELWFDAEENEVELARLIVKPEIRGKGVGRELVRGLLAQAIEAGFDDVFMRVHPDNGRALKCYLGSGFMRVEADLTEKWNAGQPVKYTWLKRSYVHKHEKSG
ncbi:GNAT family N-acetyltransferase [Streptomyces djakartensis]|uniref:GNAT family N-acetyltransferase n=1 Tax=Streptomyces djakartensis TaxID=68193 RepID=UPI0034DFF8A4